VLPSECLGAGSNPVAAADLALVVDPERGSGNGVGDVESAEAALIPYEAVVGVRGEPIGGNSRVGVAADDLATVVEGEWIIDLLAIPFATATTTSCAPPARVAPRRHYPSWSL